MLAASFAVLIVFALILTMKTRKHNLKRWLIQSAARLLFVVGGIGLLAAGAWEAIEAASGSYSPLAVALFVAATALSFFIVWSLRRDRGPGPGGGPPEF